MPIVLQFRDDRDRRDERRRDSRIHDDYSDDRRRDERPSRLKETEPDRLSSRTRDYDLDQSSSSYLDSRRSAFEEPNHSVCIVSQSFRSA